MHIYNLYLLYYTITKIYFFCTVFGSRDVVDTLSFVFPRDGQQLREEKQACSRGGLGGGAKVYEVDRRSSYLSRSFMETPKLTDLRNVTYFFQLLYFLHFLCCESEQDEF